MPPGAPLASIVPGGLCRSGAVSGVCVECTAARSERHAADASERAWCTTYVVTRALHCVVYSSRCAWQQ